MSFTDDYLALRKERKEDEEIAVSNSFEEEYSKLRAGREEDENIAPVRSSPFAKKTSALDSAIQSNFEKKIAQYEATGKQEGTWFKASSLWDDGYDFGDVTKTILGTGGDLLQAAATGIISIGENALDAAMTVAPYFAQGQYYANGGGYNIQADQAFNQAIETQKAGAEEFVKKDLYDEEKVAKTILPYDVENESVLGEKSDALAQSGGQLLAQLAVNHFVPGSGLALMGTTAFGSEAENALNNDATLEEAALSGLISAGAEVLTEQISGGIKFGGKALDDVLTKRIASTISNKTVRAIAKTGMDMVGEGAEEVVSGYLSAIGQQMTYMEEKELNELFSSEEALDSFIGGAVLGGFGNVTKSAIAKKKGVDSVTGLTKNEQAVVDKEVENRIAQEQKGGKKLSGKEKSEIYDQVVKDMERGYISTETIESVLGKDALAQYDALSQEAQEFKTLYETEGGKLSEKQKDRLAELKEKNKNSPYEELLKTQREKISQDVSAMTENDRLGESYREQTRKNEKFQADVSKYSEAQRKTVQNAIDSGILNNTNRSHEFVDLVAKISADKGISFDFADNAKLKESGFALDGVLVNGFVNENGVTINVQSAKALNRVVGHEIAHVLEGTELYDALQSAVTEYAKTKKEYSRRLKELTELYEGKNANVEQELVADLVGDYLFTDADFIRHLSTEHRNLFQKIYDEIKYLCKVVTAGTKEARQLEKVKKAFADAYRAETKNPTAEGGVRYSLMAFEKDGRRFVEIDQDQDRFDGHSVDEYPGIAKEIIKEKFENRVIGIDNKMFVNGAGRSEFAYPSKPITDTNIYEAKMRSSAELDNLLDAGTNFRNEADGKDGHIHPDAVGGFDYFDTLFKIGNKYFEGTINIKNIKRGKLFTDVTQIKDVTQAIMSSYGKNPKSQFLRTSSMNSIREPNQNVKQKNAVYLDAVSRGDMQTAQQMVDEAAKNAGYASRVYHGTDAFGFTKLDVSKSDDGISFFATDRIETASTYSRGDTSGVRRLSEDQDSDSLKSKESFSEEEFSNIAKNMSEFMSSEIGIANYADVNAIIDPNITDFQELNKITQKWMRDVYETKYAKERKNGVFKRYKNFEAFEFSDKGIELRKKISAYKSQLLHQLELKNGSAEASGIYDFYANTENHLVVECGNATWNKIESTDLPDVSSKEFEKYKSINKKYWTTRSVGAYAKANGYSGVTFKNIKDTGGNGVDATPATVYIFFNPQEQLKSADTVTYDDNGNVIPLSERFNVTNNDIRYSLSKKDFSIAPPVGADVHGKDIGYDIAPPIPASVPRVNKARPKVGDPAYAPIAEKYVKQANTDDSQMAQERPDELYGPWRMKDSLDIRVEKLYRMALREKISEEEFVAQLVKADRLYQKRGEFVEAALERVREAYSRYSATNIDNDQMTMPPETEAQMTRLTRKVLHKSRMETMREALEKEGYDLDELLSEAKRLSTFATVDNTPQRVIEKTFGYEAGQIINDLTVNKVALNESEGIRWLNSRVEAIRNLSKKYDIKPGSKESRAAQIYGEGFWVNEAGEYITYGDAELAADFPDTKKQERIKKLAKDPEVRKMYDETLESINEVRVRNGYPPIPKRADYFLHFRAMDDTFSRLGVPFNPNDIKAKDLPTDLNGMTADLKPGKPFFASEMQRKGNRTTYDLLGGMERYMNSAKNQIYHVDDIQTLRAFRNYIADMFGQANGLSDLDSLSPEEQEIRIKEVFDGHLSTFAKFLNEEANILAGKTALIDRGIEGVLGRRAIQFLHEVNGQVGKNMVGWNISSAGTNVLPIVQAMAKLPKVDIVRAFAQTVSNKFRNDGFVENDLALIRRRGANRFAKTFWQKISDPGYALMSAVDNLSSEVIVRAKYNELTRKQGMDSQQAHIRAGEWASRLMGDRSLGQMPQLYNSKTLGLITKFQLEVRNQLDAMGYDTIQEAKAEDMSTAKKAAKITYTMAQLAIFQHLFGQAYEAIAGYNPAFDIVENIIKLFGFDDEEESEDTFGDNLEQAFLGLLEDLPYTGTFTGGRIPIESALPIEEFITGKDSYGNEKDRFETIGEALPYYILPGGYGQLKKTWTGLQMFDEDLPVAGSYTDSGNMRFPVEANVGNVAQAAVFGQYANANARDYFDNGRSPLKTRQIHAFMCTDMSIQDYWAYREGLSAIEADKDEDGKTISGSKKEKVVKYIENLDISDDAKHILFKYEYPSDDTYNYEIIDYLNSRTDISYTEIKAILEELGFTVDTKGNITWD